MANYRLECTMKMRLIDLVHDEVVHWLATHPYSGIKVASSEAGEASRIQVRFA